MIFNLRYALYALRRLLLPGPLPQQMLLHAPPLLLLLLLQLLLLPLLLQLTGPWP